MGELIDLIDHIVGERLLLAADLIKRKGLTGADEDIAILQARAHGLEAAIKQVAVKVEQLSPLAED